MKLLKILALLALLAATFAGGYVLRASRRSTPVTAGRRVLYYVDPMHPSYTSDKPGIAPDCGMTLEPVYADDTAAGMGGAAPPVNAPPGAFRISPERQQLIGVKFATVELGGTSRSIRTVGKVTFDETRVAHVHTRIEGWIEKVFVDFTGDIVKAGQPMLTIYSPEMLASQQELLLAKRARDLMQANPLASAAEHGESLFQAAKLGVLPLAGREDAAYTLIHVSDVVRALIGKLNFGAGRHKAKVAKRKQATDDTDLAQRVREVGEW